MSLAPDVVLADRYQLEQRIAAGGMGEVWRARDGVLGRLVAVKVLRAEHAADPSFLERFRREARHTAALSHPGIANVFDYGEVGDVAYLVMELVDGEPLSAVLAREGALSPRRTLDIVGQAALALQAAHDAGVVHRDVKPGNLLLRRDGVIKVTDFGIARAIDAAQVTRTGLVVGTAAYISPEQAAGEPASPASDVYSLGVVAYECLSGRRPFAGDSAVGVAMAHLQSPAPPLPEVPAAVADLVMQALEKDPRRRPPSAGDLGRTALALVAVLDAAPAGTAPPPGVATTTVPHTKVLTGLPPDEETAGPAYDDRQRRRVRNVFVAIGAAVVVIGFFVLRACSGTSYAHVPGVTGDTYRQAAGALARLDLRAHERVVHDFHHRAGVVLSSSPKSGTRLPTGTTVTLTVASGPLLVSVDPASYVGQQVATATAALRAKNLRVSVSSAPAPQPAGTVTAVDPHGSVREGTTVTLTVAAAPAPPPAKPPGHDKGHHHGD